MHICDRFLAMRLAVSLGLVRQADRVMELQEEENALDTLRT